MADAGKVSNRMSQPNSARSVRPKSSSTRNSTAKSGQRDLLSREEEYKKLNAELEKRTATLVKEAEAVMNQQETVLRNNSASLLDNISTDDLIDDWEADDITPSSKPPAPKKPVYSTSASTRRPAKISATLPRSKTSVTTHSQDNITNEFNDIQSAVDEIESRLSVTNSMDIPEDILPSAAQEMSSDAQIRFLKAKARVMQEEMEHLSTELTSAKEENNKLSSHIKELEDERNKLARTNANQQTTLDKVKKTHDDQRNKSEFLESQISALKKELDEIKRSQKQQQASQSAADVRLNRALEEVEKYKLQLNKVKEQNKSTVEGDKQKLERLLAENKRLEKQKGELMAGFKKQLKLIDILKRQKMHIEAAKMLSFTEEEFVKALEWGN